MKEYIDFFTTLQGELLAKKRLHSKLKKHWGTEVVDGVEVFKKKFRVWPGTNDVGVKKVLKLLGSSAKEINESSKKGITALYLTFNPSKYNADELNGEALANVVEREVPFGEIRKFNINYTEPVDPSKFVGWSESEIFEYINSNYTDIIQKDYIEARGDTIVEDTIGMYILLDDGTDFEVNMINASVRPVPVQIGLALNGLPVYRYDSGITVEFEYRRIGYLNDSSPIITAMLDANNTNEQRRLELLRMEKSAFYSEEEWVSSESKKTTDSLWYKDQIRVDSEKLLKVHDYGNLIGGSLDFTYDKKKTKSWKKILVVIAVVVISYFTGGAAAGAASAAGASATSATIVGIAAGATAASMAFSLAGMYFANRGEFGGASFVGRWAKVAGIVSLVAGIASVISSLATKAGTTLAAQQTAGTMTGTVSGVSMGLTTTTITTSTGATTAVSTSAMIQEMVTTVIADVSNSSWASMFSKAMQVVGKVAEIREKNKAKKLESLSNEIQAQEETIMEMYDKNLHMGVEDIKMSTNNLRLDNIQFEVDYQYEGDGRNILRPTFARFGLNEIVKV